MSKESNDLARHDEELVARLEDAAELERAEMTEALALGMEDSSDFIEQARIVMESQDPEALAAARVATSSFGRPGIGWLVAAALVLLAVIRPWQSTSPLRFDSEVLLHEDGVQLISPLGPVDQFEVFEWNALCPPAGKFELTLEEFAEDGGRELGRWSTRETKQIAVLEGQALPKRLVWQLRVLDATGVELGRGRGRAWIED